MQFSIVNALVHTKTVTTETFEELEPYVNNHHIAFGTFKEGHRSKANFIQASIMGIDIDCGLSRDVAAARIKDFAFLMAPSKSDGIDGIQKTHIILPLEHPITDVATYECTYRTFMAHYFPEADANCAEAARYFNKGKPVCLTNAGKSVPVITPPSKKKAGRPAVSGIKGRISDKTEGLCQQVAPWLTDKQFRNKFVGALCDLKLKGYTYDDVVEHRSPLSRILPEGVNWNADDLVAIEDVMLNKEVKGAPQSDNPYDDTEIYISLIDHKDVRVLYKKTLTIQPRDERVLKRVIPNLNIIPAVFEYNPRKTEIVYTNDEGEKVLNIYNPPSWLRPHFFFGEPVPKTKMPDIYTDMFHHIFDGDKESIEYALDWAANSLRNKNECYLLTVGKQGTGKGTFASILAYVHGWDEGNAYIGGDEGFKSSFNGHYADKTFILVDEVNAKDDEAMNKIKLANSQKVETRIKNKTPYSSANFKNYQFASNSLDCVQLTSDDRRFSIPAFTDVPMNTRPWYKEWVESGKFLDPKLIAQFGCYLWHRKITHNMHVPFVNKAKLKLIREADTKFWETCAFDEGIRLEGRLLKRDNIAGFLQTLVERTGLKGLRAQTLIESIEKHPEKARILDNGDIEFLNPDNIEIKQTPPFT